MDNFFKNKPSYPKKSKIDFNTNNIGSRSFDTHDIGSGLFDITELEKSAKIKIDVHDLVLESVKVNEKSFSSFFKHEDHNINTFNIISDLINSCNNKTYDIVKSKRSNKEKIYYSAICEGKKCHFFAEVNDLSKLEDDKFNKFYEYFNPIFSILKKEHIFNCTDIKNTAIFRFKIISKTKINNLYWKKIRCLFVKRDNIFYIILIDHNHCFCNKHKPEFMEYDFENKYKLEDINGNVKVAKFKN